MQSVAFRIVILRVVMLTAVVLNVVAPKINLFYCFLQKALLVVHSGAVFISEFKTTFIST